MKLNEISNFKKWELRQELAHEDDPNYDPATYYGRKPKATSKYGLKIDSRPWMKDGKRVEFFRLDTAERAAATIRGRGKQVEIEPLA